jgi:riboflavin synthase
VSLIPHTGKSTVLLDKKPGDTVNLENDIIGKYVERFINETDEAEQPKSNITMEFLAKAGF